MTRPRIVGGLVLLLLTVVFTLQNTEVVTFQFFFWAFTMSRHS